jgi:hypothetical protein
VKKRQTAEAMLEQGADKVYSGPVKKQSGVIAVAAGNREWLRPPVPRPPARTALAAGPSLDFV